MGFTQPCVSDEDKVEGIFDPGRVDESQDVVLADLGIEMPVLVLVNIYILFKIPTMTHSLFTGGTGGHGGGLGLAMAAIRAAM